MASSSLWTEEAPLVFLSWATRNEKGAKNKTNQMKVRFASIAHLSTTGERSAQPGKHWRIGVAACRHEIPRRYLFPFTIAFPSSRFDDRRMSYSIRNKIAGTVREITSEKVLSEIIIDTTIGPLAAVITTRSVRDMQLKVGDSVSALVKATNVSVEKESSK
jgi:molybdopterin-binding protein